MESLPLEIWINIAISTRDMTVWNGIMRTTETLGKYSYGDEGRNTADKVWTTVTHYPGKWHTSSIGSWLHGTATPAIWNSSMHAPFVVFAKFGKIHHDTLPAIAASDLERDATECIWATNGKVTKLEGFLSGAALLTALGGAKIKNSDEAGFIDVINRIIVSSDQHYVVIFHAVPVIIWLLAMMSDDQIDDLLDEDGQMFTKKLLSKPQRYRLRDHFTDLTTALGSLKSFYDRQDVYEHPSEHIFGVKISVNGSEDEDEDVITLVDRVR